MWRDRLVSGTFKVNMRLREPLGYFNGVGVSPMWRRPAAIRRPAR